MVFRILNIGIFIDSPTFIQRQCMRRNSILRVTNLDTGSDKF